MTELIVYNDYLKGQLSNSEKLIYEYNGVFDQEIVKKYAFELNKLSKNYVITQRRLFYVFVELGQNVGYYSDTRVKKKNNKIGCGNLVIYQNNKHIGFIIGNEINNAALKVLLQKCKIINSLNREELREFKRYQRNLIPGTNGGAHIGLIMVALTTRKKLEIKVFNKKQKKSFFTINVKVDKEKPKPKRKKIS